MIYDCIFELHKNLLFLLTFFPKLLLDALKIAFLEEEKVSEDARGRNPLAHTKKDR